MDTESPRSIRIPPPRFSPNGVPARALASRRDQFAAGSAGSGRSGGWLIFLPEIAKLGALLLVRSFDVLDRLLHLFGR